MTTPDLILQQRNIARSMRENLHRYNKSLDALNADRQHDIVAAEQQWLDAGNQLEAQFAKFLELERIARSKVRAIEFGIFDKINAVKSPVTTEGPTKTLVECISEIEAFLVPLKRRDVVINFVNIPSDVDEAAYLSTMRAVTHLKWIRPPIAGGYLTMSWEMAHTLILELEKLGIKVELAT